MNDELLNEKYEKIAREDPRKIIESLFYIVNKAGKKVPFILNEPQRIYYENRSERDDVLKARKEGFSSLILAMLGVQFLFIPNTVCATVSHRDEDTVVLFEKVKYYLDNLPLNVTFDIANEKRLRLGGKHNCDFYIGTAGSKTFGRGNTIHRLHLSEFAHYPKWDMVTGLLNAVPDDLENTYIVKETTANGYGTPHHTAWEDEVKGESAFKPHFFSWADNPEYSMEITDGVIFTEKERDLQQFMNLTDEQLMWRKWKISQMQPTQDYSKEELFKQEYPATAAEAFLSSGRPVFDPDNIDWYQQVMVKSPEKRGVLIGWNPPTVSVSDVGELRIYEEPKKGRDYVVGGDTAETGDYSALIVMDRSTMNVVAVWWGRADEYELANNAYKLGTYYNDALVGIERNNMGVAVVMKLDDLGYKNQYQMEILDEIGRKIKDKLGWETNSKTRPLMIGDLIEVFANRQIGIPDENILKEMRSMTRGKNNKPEAQEGAHDDLVMALAIALQMYKAIPESSNKLVFVRNYRPNTSLNKFIRNKEDGGYIKGY